MPGTMRDSDFPYMTDEEWALHDATVAYVADRISLDRFEATVEAILGGNFDASRGMALAGEWR